MQDTPEHAVAMAQAARLISFRGGDGPGMGDRDRRGPLSRASTTISLGSDGRARVQSVRLRLTHRCDTTCPYCFVPYEPNVLDERDAGAALEAAIRAGARDVVFTGGEPTIHPDLVSLVRTAREAGVMTVGLQTNGIRLSDPGLCRALRDAGLTYVEVSLPTHLRRKLGRMGRSLSSHAKILSALGNVTDAGLPLAINHVVFALNYRDVAAFTRFVTGRWDVAVLTFLLAAPFSRELATRDILVRYSDAAPYVLDALDHCIAHDIRFDGLWEKCGMPLCMLGRDPVYFPGARPIASANRSPDFEDVPACEDCSLRESCYRVRRLYLDLYGAEEFAGV